MSFSTLESASCDNYEITDDLIGSESDLDLSTYLRYEAAQFSRNPWLETVFIDDEGCSSGDACSFSSDFECGNLARVDKVHFSVAKAGDTDHYVCWMKSDPQLPRIGLHRDARPRIPGLFP